MADPTPTRLHTQPPISQWRVSPRNGRITPVIATGHQPTLWHPGILAKYLACDAFARHVGGKALQVVVEHNTLDPLAIDLPTQQDNALGQRRLALDPRPAADHTPPNRLAPLETGRVVDAISDAAAASDLPSGLSERLAVIARAYADQPEHPHLAAQTSAVLAELMHPYTGPIDTRASSDLVTQGFVDRLLADPVGCVRCYNRAAIAYPQAHIRPLYAGRDAVEAPLWAQADARPTPVYIDLGDSKRPLMFTQGQAIDLTGPDGLKYLRPRAVTLSAIMRSEHCDLFIHGTGGGLYDQVTERWWHDWVGEALAPMAVVSADVFMGFDVPLASRDELTHAVWFDHHLPFNVDRYTRAKDDAEAALQREKQALLDHMDDDRDKRRRAKAFKRVHAINAELQGRHQAKLDEAHRQAEDTRIGVHNRVIAGRRDWFFALYAEAQLQALHTRIADAC